MIFPYSSLFLPSVCESIFYRDIFQVPGLHSPGYEDLQGEGEHNL